MPKLQPQPKIGGTNITAPGEFNWTELQTADAGAAIRFYEATVGWSFQAEHMPSGGDYWIGSASGRPVCGILTTDSSSDTFDDRWMTYVHIDDVDQKIAKVDALGGSIVRPPWDVPGVGRIAMIRDPGGAELGWVTPVRN